MDETNKTSYLPHFSYGFFSSLSFIKNSEQKIPLKTSLDWVSLFLMNGVFLKIVPKCFLQHNCYPVICVVDLFAKKMKWKKSFHVPEWKPKKEENKTSKQAQKAFYAVFQLTNELLLLSDVIVA